MKLSQIYKFFSGSFRGYSMNVLEPQTDPSLSSPHFLLVISTACSVNVSFLIKLSNYALLPYARNTFILDQSIQVASL